MFDVTPLGVGAAIPTRDRHLSATLVRREGRSVLFDCGEGTQLQLVRGELTRGPLDAVCITHLHGDHLFGLPGLISTLALLDRPHPLTIVGPKGVTDVLRAIPNVDPGRLPFDLTTVELVEGDDGRVVFEDEHVTVEARPLDHRVPCWGYRLSERARPGALDADAARAAGVPDGEAMGALKRGEPVTLGDGRRVTPDGLVGPEQPGEVFAYVLDTAPCDGARALAHAADLVLHEATYGDEYAERAAEVGHSTARQAAETARDAGARRLLLTHFSARHPDPAPLVAEAREVFAATDAAEELVRYEVQR